MLPDKPADAQTYIIIPHLFSKCTRLQCPNLRNLTFIYVKSAEQSVDLFSITNMYNDFVSV